MLLYTTLGFHFLVGYLRISCITRKLVFSRFGKTVARIGVSLMLRGGTLFVYIGLKKRSDLLRAMFYFVSCSLFLSDSKKIDRVCGCELSWQALFSY